MSEKPEGKAASEGGWPPQVKVIEPGRGWRPIRVKELWEFRELLWLLVWRDVKVRYKQTVLGAGWAIVQPLTTVIIFSIIFSRLGRLPTDGLPAVAFYMATVIPWTYFAGSISSGGNSLVAAQSIIAKVYFPRLMLPMAATLVPLVDFVVAATLLVIVGWAYSLPISLLGWFKGLLCMAPLVLAAMALNVWLSALNAIYRDVRYMIPFMIQVLLFASPVAYPAELIPPAWRLYYSLNPVVGPLEAFRSSLVGSPMPVDLMTVSAATTVLLLGSGLIYFRRIERTLADVL